ncbi:MAG: tRNA lysidine(34) synthetase TilS, partial [Bacteroidota bacterium]
MSAPGPPRRSASSAGGPGGAPSGVPRRTVFHDRLRAALRRLGLPARGPVVVGVSGGVDSTVLWRSLHALGVPTVGVHVDYGLREASGADAAFVQALGETLGVPVEVRGVELGEGNTQAVAREARYAVFREIAEASGARAVAVGHTATDQAETVLLNLVRGAGLAGLAGMPESRPLAPKAPVRLVRPLLGVTRAEVEAEARARGWAWREDATNATDVYRRNRLRHRVLPLLEEEGGLETALRIAAAARAAQAASGEVAGRLARVGEVREDGGAVPLGALRVLTDAERGALVAEMLRAWAPEAPRSEALVQQIASLFD